MEKIVVIISKEFQVHVPEGKLREKGYIPFVCKRVPDVVDAICMVPKTKARVFLVIIDPAILDEIAADDELVVSLSNCDKRIPFVIMGQAELKSESTEIFYRLCEGRKRFNSEALPLTKELERWH